MLFGMNRLQRSSINVISSTIGWVVPVLINLIATPLLLHELGEAAYGLQNLTMVVIGYLALMNMGLDIPVTKFLAEDHTRGDTESENRLLSTALQLYGIIGLGGMIVAWLAADLLVRQVFKVPDELVEPAKMVFALAGVGFLANMMMMWGKSIADGLQRLDVSSVVSIATSLGSVGIGLIVVYAGYGVVGYVLVLVIILGLLAVAYFFIARRLLPQFRLIWGLDRPMLLRLWGYMSYGIILRVSGLLVSGLDRTLIGAWLGVAAVTIYAVPSQMAALLGRLVGQMLQFIFPMASELYSTGQVEKLQDVFMRTTRFVAASATAIMVPLFILGDIFLALWVGPDLAQQAAPVLRLLVLAYYVQTLAVVLTNPTMVGIGHIRIFTAYTLVKGGMIGVGCVLLIRPLGVKGAGLALLLAEVVDIGFLILVLKRYLLISPGLLFRVAYLRPILLGIIVAGLAFLARPLVTSWLGLGAVGGCLGLFYVVVGYGIGVFGETEKRAIVGLWRAATKSARGLLG